MYDLIVKNGKFVDGTGNPWCRADLAISGKRVIKIGKIDGLADKTIDAKELIVSPGFIDIHSHAGFTLLVNPKAESLVRQGVTTVVIGNCGHAPYPGLVRLQQQCHRIRRDQQCLGRTVSLYGRHRPRLCGGGRISGRSGRCFCSLDRGNRRGSCQDLFPIHLFRAGGDGHHPNPARQR